MKKALIVLMSMSLALSLFSAVGLDGEVVCMWDNVDPPTGSESGVGDLDLVEESNDLVTNSVQSESVGAGLVVTGSSDAFFVTDPERGGDVSWRIPDSDGTPQTIAAALANEQYLKFGFTAKKAFRVTRIAALADRNYFRSLFGPMHLQYAYSINESQPVVVGQGPFEIPLLGGVAMDNSELGISLLEGDVFELYVVFATGDVVGEGSSWYGSTRFGSLAIYGDAFLETRIRSIKHDAVNDQLLIVWNSQAGTLYRLRSSTSLSMPQPWPLYLGSSYLTATPPENTLILPVPADSSRFFTIESYFPDF